MFIQLPFDSVNSTADLPAGQYSVKASTYAEVGTSTRVLMLAYEFAYSAEVLAYDMLIYLPGGAVLARDFVWMKDRSWRDSDGRKSQDLPPLLPTELKDLVCISAEDGDDVWVGSEVGHG